ncbi:phosphate-selective porin O and P [Novosphingobium aromaticivorans DSM 12444]|uniref:Phosphate-selective porin O and P n=1 Tax=Novosphingobium aromaticivorans (strain ATCC 700278 / DSM 12444 / CCUG 56034 / CIP 105152 / NBRC 16084 / F199) TaxID=279238 RepID=Q2G4W5_NOVAD|nr:porin [Novosphingobium aromaticivorans]ABD27108.1 phosphate-selective porin O and P [Novosphingobium aromaticivorans DSM 12444]SCY88868.1 phosphate-selective porin OprO and OprP [Novosphingobium aromaticivorans]
MKTVARVSVIALACAAGWSIPAHASTAKPDLAALQAQLQQMQSQMQSQMDAMQAMQAQIATLQNQLAEAKAKGDATATAVAAIPAPTVTGKPPVAITWDGGPRIESPVDPKNPKAGKWSFKPRGRLQIDAASVMAPSSIGSKSLGIGSEFRRAYLGVDGTIPGNFGYRIEADFANSSVELTDVFLTYNGIRNVTVTLGQQKPFESMEDTESDLFTSFMERASFNTAFGFERRLGLSAQYQKGMVLAQVGAFTDNVSDLNADSNNSYSIDGRFALQPKLMGGQLHLGGSAHYHDLNDGYSTVRYRARPFTHTTDVRFVDTKAISALSETNYGLEFAWTGGPLHFAAESQWMKTNRPGALADPTFNGGYAEAGLFLTKGDTLPYRLADGAWGRIKPKNPVDKGGIGAVQVNVRYDWLDLNDNGVIGGRQQLAGASLLWVPTDYVRFILDYGHMWINDAAVAAGTDRSYSADVLGMRAQFDF